MSRKKTKGRTPFYTHYQPKKSSPEHRFAETVDRPGQKQQIGLLLHETALPSNHRFIVGHQGSWVLTRCWEYSGHPSREFLALSKGQKLKCPLYHGTNLNNVGSIVLKGLKPGGLKRQGGMFGNAVYLAPNIYKAFSYTRTGTIFVVEAALGRIRNMERSDSSLNSDRASELCFDTAHGVQGQTHSWNGTLLFSEFAVYNPHRVHLRYILEFTFNRTG